MDEHRSPAVVAADPTASINALLAGRLERYADVTFIKRKATTDARWEPVTAREFDAAVVAVAKGLVARGIEPGQSVGIMSRTRFEWTLLDFAIWAAGAVPVPLYETSSAEQVQWILSDADVRLLVVETAEHAAVVAETRPTLTGLQAVLVLDDGAIDTLAGDGAEVADEEITRRRAVATGADVATIIYTSGTTGRPKGVEFTHGNFVDLALNAVAELGEQVCPPGSRTLLFMPLAHVFARFVEVLVVPAGVILGHTPDSRDLESGVWPRMTPAGTTSTSTNRANTWARGMKSRVREPGGHTCSPSSATALSARSTKFPWVNSTPFGRPVVPEV